MSKTTIVKFTDRLTLDGPFWLFVGRKKQLVTRPSEVVVEREHLQSENDDETGLDFISPLPVRETLLLFIDGSLFSTTHATGSHRHSARIVRPSHGHIAVKLTKRFTKVESITGI